MPITMLQSVGIADVTRRIRTGRTLAVILVIPLGLDLIGPGGRHDEGYFVAVRPAGM